MAIPSLPGAVALTAIGAVPNLASLPGANAASNFLGSLQSRLITTPPGVTDIMTFIFDYAGEARLELESEITDHYSELNSSLQDHIGLKPVRITLKGFVAELVQKTTGAAALLGTVQNILTQVPSYLGGYSPAGTVAVSKALSQAQNVQNTVNQYVSQGKNLYNLFTGSSPGQTKQQEAYAQLEAMWLGRLIFTIVTPWKIYPSMAIERLTPVQSENSRNLSEFTVVLKQMNFASLAIQPNYLSTFAGRLSSQSEALSQSGQQPNVQTDASMLYKAFGGRQ